MRVFRLERPDTRLPAGTCWRSSAPSSASIIAVNIALAVAATGTFPGLSWRTATSRASTTTSCSRAPASRTRRGWRDELDRRTAACCASRCRRQRRRAASRPERHRACRPPVDHARRTGSSISRLPATARTWRASALRSRPLGGRLSRPGAARRSSSATRRRSSSSPRRHAHELLRRSRGARALDAACRERPRRRPRRSDLRPRSRAGPRRISISSCPTCIAPAASRRSSGRSAPCQASRPRAPT